MKRLIAAHVILVLGVLSLLGWFLGYTDSDGVTTTGLAGALHSVVIGVFTLCGLGVYALILELVLRWLERHD